MINKLLLALTLALSMGISAQNTIYVNQQATGIDNGNSWTDAYSDLQSALAAAQANDQIWVAAGTYKPGTLDTDTFNIITGVKLLGGFNGTETTAEERNWAENPTILSGDLDNSNSANAGDSHTIVKHVG